MAALFVAGLTLSVDGRVGAQGPRAEPPATPTGLTGTFTHESVSLSWDDPGDPGDPSITGYQILRRQRGVHEVGDFQVHVDDTNSAATSYVDTAVEAEASYVYRVKARNSSGLSERSRFFRADLPAAPDPPAPGLPGPPPNLTAAAAGETQINLSWTAPGNTNGSEIVGYRIEVSTDRGTSWNDLVAGAGATITTYAHTGLMSGATRHYRVSAINSVGTGAPSNIASATTGDLTPPRFVAGVVGADGDSLELYFNESLDLDPGRTPLSNSFVVTADGAPVAVGAVQVIPGREQSVSLIGLSPAIREGQTASVSYTDPTSGNDEAAIQDRAGNDAASLADQPVTNGSTLTGASTRGAPAQDVVTQPATATATAQIGAILAAKAQRTPAQRKVSSRLLDAIGSPQLPEGQEGGGEEPQPPAGSGPRQPAATDGVAEFEFVTVDIRADVTPEVLGRIRALGGTVINSVPKYRAIRAQLPLVAVQPLAALSAVQSIRPADEAVTHKDDTSEGDAAHLVNTVRTTHGVTGSGIGIGVISDGVATLAARQASGDLPAQVAVLPGQEGSGDDDEGTAMLEIVHDLAPGADLYFATGFSGQAQFAANIEALCEAGADVIVDDLTYYLELTFQDSIIAQGVNAATANGCYFFSSAGNGGNLNDETSGVWEGDYEAGTAMSVGGSTVGVRHDFGGGKEENAVRGAFSGRAVLQWADPLGASANDYDLFLVDGAGTVWLSSTDTQDGAQDPIETVSLRLFAYEDMRLVIVQVSGEARYLRLQLFSAKLEIATAGATFGHSASENTVGVGQVDVRTAGGAGGIFDGTESVTEGSSDGPRRLFYEPDGTPITPDNFSSTGGKVLQKPDLSAASCVSTATPGFSTFCGTSAAAPHAAAIAALMLAAAGGPAHITPADLRTAMTATTAVLDIEQAGFDNNSGAGIVMAPGAIAGVAVAVADRNGAPTAASALTDRTLVAGSGAVTIDLASTFTDPDSDALTYSVVSSDPERLGVTLSGTEVTLTPGSPGWNTVWARVTDPGGLGALQTFTVTVTAGNADYDTDNDRLIEVSTLAQLDAIRYDLNGNGLVDGATWEPYYAAFSMGALEMGCPNGCIGYELAANLDFDTDGSGTTSEAGDTYWNDGAGWEPIGSEDNPYIANFWGESHILANLFINRPMEDGIGLFGELGYAGTNGHISDVGLVEVDVTGRDRVGALFGRSMYMTVFKSYATGRVTGRGNKVGGLAGESWGNLIDTYAAVEVSGPNLDQPPVSGEPRGTGGLVGLNRGLINSSYATGDVTGSPAGGLVGWNSGGFISTSYATGAVTGTTVGGLVGRNDGPGRIQTSYATGRVSGNRDVGGLIGTNASIINANYSTGPVSATSSTDSSVGGLVGANESAFSRITESYWDSTTSGIAGARGLSTAALQGPTGLDGIYQNWSGRWHFGTSSQYPALSVDFDGDVDGDETWQEFGHQLRAGPELTATGGEDQVVLSWPPVDAGHWTPPPGITYTLYRDATVVAENLSTLSYQDSDLTAGTYTYQVAAVVDGGEATRSAPVTATVIEIIPNNQPRFPSSETGARSVDENTAAGMNIGTAITAEDDDDDHLTYSISGADAAFFDVVTTSGQLQTEAALDRESRATYSFTMSVHDAKDSNGHADPTVDHRITVTVTVADVDEAGKVTLWPAEPRMHTVLSATLEDPDGGVRSVSWRWSTSTDQINWAQVSTSGSSYAPARSNVGRYIRARASYSDASGSGKTAEAVSSHVVGEGEAAPAITVVPLVTQLHIPWDLAFTPDGTMLFTERAGRLVSRLTNGTVLAVTADFSDLYVVSEAGLMAIVVDPGFSTNRRFYTCQAHSGAEVQVIAWTMNEAYTAATRVDDPLVGGIPAASRHSGCRLRFGPQGYLWIATGDATMGTVPQDLASLGGKVLRVNATTGAAAPGNPFSSLVYTYGHRNVQGLALRPGTNQMWSVEHGPTVDDEINLLTAGGNYGWNPVPGYNESVPMTDLEEFSEAVAAKWSSGDPTLATSGGIFLEGAEWEEWNGRLAVATLKNESLRIFHFNTDGTLVSHVVAPKLDGAYGRLRTPVLGPDGALYITTSNGGSSDSILRVVPSLPPEFPSATDTQYVAENRSTSTVVATVAATDADDEALTYTLGGTDADSFNIDDNAVGQVRANLPLDREVKSSYTVTVTATDPWGLSDRITLTIIVSDVNETPEFPPTEDGMRSVPENTPARRTFGDPVAAVAGDNDTLTYSITSGANLFDINTATGQLLTKAPLDREAAPSHTIRVGVSDGKDANNMAEDPPVVDNRISVTVTVTNVNEAPAVTGRMTFQYEENGTAPLGRYTAADPENEDLDWTPRGLDAGLFQISSSGELAFKSPPDREMPKDSGENNVYDVIVRATDRPPTGTPLWGTHPVTVTVTNVDEPPILDGLANVDYAEGGTGNVATYRAVDPEGATIIWTLAGAQGGDFTITNGVLKFRETPDYEEASSYQLTVIASDGNPLIVARQDVTVDITNLEEAGTLTLSSDQPSIGVAFTATLADPDGVRSSTWEWRRADSRSAAGVVIAGATGETYTPTGDDRDKYLRVKVVYTDGHGAGKEKEAVSKFATQPDRTTNTAPSFPANPDSLSVREDARGIDAVGDPVVATDEEHDPITYSLTVSGAPVDPPFTIDRSSGQIRVAAGVALDHETRPSHSVTVTATDSFNAEGSTTVTIEVTNVNEAPAVTGRMTIQYAENGGDAVASYRADDPENQAVDWTPRGLDAGLFQISSTGVLAFKLPPDFEVKRDSGRNNVYDVIVRATDRDAQNPLRGTLPVAVTILDVNETPEFPPTENGIRNVPENTPAGRTFGTPVAAVAGDNDTLTYSITSGANLFDINTATGQLLTKASLDREAAVSHHIAVGVSDGKDANNMAEDPPVVDNTISVTIAVGDVDEPPVVTGTKAVTKAENSGEAVGEYTATDPEDKDLTWETLMGADAGHFAFDNGALSFKEDPDYEARPDNTYEVTVRARDERGNIGELRVTVTITNVDERPTITGDDAPSIEEGGTLLDGTYQATDPESATIAWQPLAGNDMDKFEFTPSNGRLAFKAAPDFEDADRGGDNEYDVTLSVSAGGHTITFDVAVTVTNKEEPGTLALPTTQPQAEANYTATLSDPDGVQSQSTTWTWERSMNRSGPWATVSGAFDSTTTSVYTPVTGDVGHYLRATAAYTDGHGPNKSRVAVSTNSVRAKPVINNPPAFTETTLTRSVAENARANAPVGDRVTATDPDPGDQLRYEFELPVPDLFTIDGSSGQIRVKAQGMLDHETAPSHTVTVKALDSSNAFDTVQVTIEVTDVNEPPDALADAPNSFDEDTEITIEVLNNDSDPEDDRSELLLTVFNSGPNAPRNGAVTVNEPANAGENRTITYEPKANYNGSDTFTYQVRDTGSPSLSSTASVTVQIDAVNDAPVFPPSETGARSVSESAKAGANVGSAVTATDVDENDTLTYSLFGAGASSFEIDSNGQITVGDGVTFDIATKDTYTVMVEAYDGNERATVEVTITVTARPVGPPIITGGGGGGGGGPSGPSPSEVDFEWNVKRDIEELDGGHDKPTGSWSDGTTLWLAENGDGADDAVYAYDLKTGERLEEREFELDEANRAPRGLWSNGQTAWVADSGRDRLFAYDLESGERDEEREVELDQRNRDPRGIWSDGTTVWVLDGGKNALFAYDLETGALLGEYALNSSNGDPHGIWSDGVSVWVSDHGAKRLFAYRIAVQDTETTTGEDAAPVPLERVRDEEFANLSRASNNSPRGIWSDGAVMYVADESDGKVYSYNLPDAIDARLATFTLSGVDFGEFDPGVTEYEGIVGEGVTETTVEAAAMQRRTRVAIDPVDSDDDEANGHQVTLAGTREVMVTVTSADNSRTKVYRVRFGETRWDPARDPWPHCLRGAISEGFSLVVYEGGSVEELVNCAESRNITAFYALHEGVYVPYILGAPDFVNREFGELFAGGLPVMAPLVAGSNGPPSADPFGDDLDDDVQQQWPQCLRGRVAEGFSLVVYEGGSVEELAACAESREVSALYALHEGEFVSYILGAPDFVNREFRELFADGLPAVTPLVARSEGRPLAN